MSKTNICRFCSALACYKNLDDEYFYYGTLENYGDMLFETFNLDLRKYRNGCICDECISKLREANKFKKKVLEAESNLVSLSEVKNEDMNNGDCLKIENGVDKDVILNIEESSVSPRLHSEGEFKTEIYNQYSENDKSDVNLEEIVFKNNSNKILKEKGNPGTQRPPSLVQKQLRDNTFKLISNSNICLFKSLKTRFACYYCNEKFLEINDLRTHSKIHPKDDLLRHKINRLQGISYKNADITDLKCNLCSENCLNIEFLEKHLTEKHKIKFDSSNHLLIPYNLGKGLICVICDSVFYSFYRLSTHMNVHSTTNVCEICGVSFFKRISLRNHVYSMHRSHKCRSCPLIFKTASLKMVHMKKIHNLITKKRRCLKCEESFKHSFQLKEHMIVKHGLKRPDSNCEFCEKKFKTRNLLGIHIRNVHKKERKFKCGNCEMRFFTNYDRKRHEDTHSNSKSVQCEHCDALFKTKDYLRRHVKKFHVYKK